MSGSCRRDSWPMLSGSASKRLEPWPARRPNIFIGRVAVVCIGWFWKWMCAKKHGHLCLCRYTCCVSLCVCMESSWIREIMSSCGYVNIPLYHAHMRMDENHLFKNDQPFVVHGALMFGSPYLRCIIPGQNYGKINSYCWGPNISQ